MKAATARPRVTAAAVFVFAFISIHLHIGSRHVVCKFIRQAAALEQGGQCQYVVVGGLCTFGLHLGVVQLRIDQVQRGAGALAQACFAQAQTSATGLPRLVARNTGAGLVPVRASFSRPAGRCRCGPGHRCAGLLDLRLGRGGQGVAVDGIPQRPAHGDAGHPVGVAALDLALAKGKHLGRRRASARRAAGPPVPVWRPPWPGPGGGPVPCQ